MTVLALVITCFTALFVTAALVYGERILKRKEKLCLKYRNSVDQLYKDTLKEKYREGDRVELQFMNMNDSILRNGDRGTVLIVDDLCVVHVLWDNGCELGLIPGEDLFLDLSEIQRFKTREKESGKEEYEKE